MSKYRNKAKNKSKFCLFIILLIYLLSTQWFVHIHIEGSGYKQYKYALYLVSDGFHSGIIFNFLPELYNKKPVDTNNSKSHKSYHKYVFYTFADRKWFMEGKMNIGQFFPTIFAQTDAVIHRVFIRDNIPIVKAVNYLRLYGDIAIWSFEVDKENIINAVSYIENNAISSKLKLKEYRGSTTGFLYTFFKAHKSYHIFYNCHHFSLDIMNKAGLPVSGKWYNFIDIILRFSVKNMIDNND
ncbi:MAG: DUF2459 domain-containing protein [Spirochaetota bacterium]